MNGALFALILEAVKAVFEFFKIVAGKKQAIEQKQDKENDDLKEAMHQALLSGDNTAIVLCLNRYNQLRKTAKDGG
jgi:hypothetical protein